MTTTTALGAWALPDLADVPNLPHFETHYGLKLSAIGDEGDIVILGHAGTLRALDAIRAHLRPLLGDDETDDAMRTNIKHPPPVTYRWAVRLTGCAKAPDCGGDDCDSPSCREITAAPWWLDCAAAPDTPAAFPVTYWST